MKKVFLIALSLLLVFVLFTACGSTKVEYNEELIKDGSFETDAELDSWVPMSGADEASTELKTVSDTNSDAYKAVGAGYLSVKASSFNTYTQTVKLQKDSVYCLSAKVKITSDISADDDLGGAFIAIDSDYALVNSVVKNTTNDWQTISCYFNSGEVSEVVVRFGVGTEKYTASGTAYFDGISLQKVENEGFFTILSQSSVQAARYNYTYRTTNAGILFVTLTTVLGGLCLFAGYVALRRLMSKKGAMLSPDVEPQNVNFFKSAAFMLVICELLAFAVRLITINFIYGGTSFDAYVTEATKLADVGAKSYYFDNVTTTPIGSLYLLWMLGALAGPLKLTAGTIGFSIFLKIPAVLADLVAVFVVYYLANRKYNQYISALFAGAYAVLPVFFFLSAGWGAYASIGALFILLSLISILDRNYALAIVYIAISLLFMTEALLLLPLFFVYFVYTFIKKGDDQKMAISIAFTASVIVLYLISLPFILSYFASGKPFIAVERYCSAFLAHTGFTENAFTVYGLFGLGAAKANVASYVFNGILVGLGVLYTVFLFFKSKSRLDLLLLGAFTFVFTFVLTSAVDTLLIYPALILLLAYGIVSGDRRVLKLFGGFTVTTLLNTSYAMMIGGFFGSTQNSVLVNMTASDPVLIIFSIANLALFGYFAYVTYSICIKEDVKGIVIIEQNYFKYLLQELKKAWEKVVAFCTETVPALFKKKEGSENAGESK